MEYDQDPEDTLHYATSQSFVNEEADRCDLKTDRGYYLKSRSFVGSSTWLMGPTVVTFVEYLIWKATYTKEPWKFFCKFQNKEILVNRGEVVCSISRMVQEIQILTRKQIRVSLRRLEQSGFLKDITPKCVSGANSYKHLRLWKFEGYQNPENYQGQLRANSGPMKGHDIRKKEREEYTYELIPTDSVNIPPTKQNKIYAENLEFTENMKRDAAKVGANGSAQPIFEAMKDWAVSNGKSLNTLRGWEARYRTFLRNAMDRQTKDSKSVTKVSTFAEKGLF